MDTIKFILNFLFKFTIVLIIMTFLLWFVSVFFPAFNLKNIFFPPKTSSSTSTSELKPSQEWLPSPTSLLNILGNKASVTSNVYVPSEPYSPGQEFSGYGVLNDPKVKYSSAVFVTYTTPTTTQTNTQESNIATQTKNNNTSLSYANRATYVRNLSIYEGGHLYTGLSFYGEARSSMFKDKAFPIIILDNQGKIASIVKAEAMDTWSVPGWVRFNAKIVNVLPNKTQCTMIFQSAYSTKENPAYVAMPALCN